MRSRTAVGLLAGTLALTALVGCTSSPQPKNAAATPATRTSAAAAAALVDPSASSQAPAGGVLLTEGRGSGSRAIPLDGAPNSGKLVFAVVCGGAGSPLSVHGADGGLLLKVSACNTVTPAVVYSSESSLGKGTGPLSLSADAATRWRIAVWTVPV